MKIWIEAFTPKQVLLFSYLQEVFGKTNVFLTTRDYDLNRQLAHKLWSRYFVIGHYPGSTPLAKLKESVRRQEDLIRVVEHERPDVHVTFVSPDSTRVAFGLGIPVITSSDSPHSDAVSRLTIPLSKKFITPSFLVKGFERYGRLTEIVSFNGLFELAWVLREKPEPEIPRGLGLEPFNYILVRPGEQKAYYYPDEKKALALPLSIIMQVLKLTPFDVLIYPRYSDQERFFRKKLSEYSERVKILDQATSFVSLEFFARIVVTGGGTMATESALLGTPAIVTYPGEVETHNFVKVKGFPLFRFPISRRILEQLLLREPTVEERRHYIEKARKMFEDPVKVYEREIKALVEQKL